MRVGWILPILALLSLLRPSPAGAGALAPSKAGQQVTLTNGRTILRCPASLAFGGCTASCKRVCEAAIERCVDAGNRVAKCERQLTRACRHAGRLACDEAFLPPSTTSTTPTTSTTMSTSASAVPDLAGTWT